MSGSANASISSVDITLTYTPSSFNRRANGAALIACMLLPPAVAQRVFLLYGTRFLKGGLDRLWPLTTTRRRSNKWAFFSSLLGVLSVSISVSFWEILAAVIGINPSWFV